MDPNDRARPGQDRDVSTLLANRTAAMVEQCQELARQISYVGGQLQQHPQARAAIQRFLLCETVLQQQSTGLEQLVVALGDAAGNDVLPLTPEEQRLWRESLRRERAMRRCLPFWALAMTLEER